MNKNDVVKKVIAKLSNEAKLSTKEKKSLGLNLQKNGMDGNGRFLKIDHALSKLHEILDGEGLEIDMILNADLFRGDSGKRLLNIARKTKDPFSPISIENSAISFSWHLLGNESQDKSQRKYEILAYVS